jgi:hypothetical protein
VGRSQTEEGPKPPPPPAWLARLLTPQPGRGHGTKHARGSDRAGPPTSRPDLVRLRVRKPRDAPPSAGSSAGSAHSGICLLVRLVIFI